MRPKGSAQSQTSGPEMLGEPRPPLTLHKAGFCFPCRQTFGDFLFIMAGLGNIFLKQKALPSTICDESRHKRNKWHLWGRTTDLC